MYVYRILLIHSSVGAFGLLSSPVVIAAMHMGVRYLFKTLLSILLNI